MFAMGEKWMITPLSVVFCKVCLLRLRRLVGFSLRIRLHVILSN